MNKFQKQMLVVKSGLRLGTCSTKSLDDKTYVNPIAICSREIDVKIFGIQCELTNAAGDWMCWRGMYKDDPFATGTGGAKALEQYLHDWLDSSYPV